MKKVILLLTVLLATPAWAAKVKPAAPPPVTANVHAQYEIYGGGFQLLDADLDINVGAQKYDARLRARTDGFLGRVAPWSDDVHAAGNRGAREMQPVAYTSANTWRGKERSVTLVYDGKGGFKSKFAVPAPEQENREEVAPELTRNTMDLMSATLTLLQRVTQGESCNQTIAVYDGRRRFNLKFYEVQFERLPESHIGIFHGAARRCDMTIERVAGFWKKFQTDWTEDGDAKMKLSFWLAPITPNGPQIPVLARTYGAFETVFIHLVGGTADGKNIKDLINAAP